MSFEQPAHSFNHPAGEPPTPTRTPTSPNFFSNSYQTPRQESKFHDPLSPWTPAFGISPLFDSQAHTAYTPLANDNPTPSASKSPKTAEDVGAEIASRVQHSSSNLNVSLAPVDTSRQLISSPQALFSFDTRTADDPTSRPGVTPSKLSSDKGASESMNSAGSIQTPPPTSTSASRRKASEVQAARSARALASKEDRRMSTPAAGNGEHTTCSNQQAEASPSTHFPNLQFSPDGFSFPMSSGPATAPVYPQHKLFWDPEQSVDAMTLDFSIDDSFTNFGLGLQKQLEPFVSDHDQTTGMDIPSTPAFSVTGTTNVSSLTAPKHSVALNQTNVSPSTVIMTQGSSRSEFADTVVNPSLLFSSPGGAPPASRQTVQDDALKPYAHQLQDAVYEKEFRSRRPKRKRGAELDSPAVKAATQALRGAEDESSVDSADRTVIASFGDPVRPMSRHSWKGSSQGRSASKGQDRHRNVVDSNKRASVTLTIDANGRAKTETKLVDDPRKSTSSKMDVDSDSSDSDSSSSHSSTGVAFSQPSSFAYPVERQKKAKTPKSQRVHGGHTSHSHHSSYASTLGSASAMNVNTRSIKINTDFRRPSQPQVHFEDSTSFISGMLAEDDSEAETIVDTDEDKGNAASALRKVVRQRSSQKLRKNSLPRQSFADHRMPQDAPSQPYYNQNTMTPSRLGYSSSQHNISPTTITDPDLATPSTGGRTVLSARSITRCVCNVAEGNGQLMVQCDSCKNWLHLDCVGLDQRNMPEIYLCIFCNHETPKVRGARREPSRVVFPPPSSPLAYKSNHYR